MVRLLNLSLRSQRSQGTQRLLIKESRGKDKTVRFSILTVKEKVVINILQKKSKNSTVNLQSPKKKRTKPVTATAEELEAEANKLMSLEVMQQVVKAKTHDKGMKDRKMMTKTPS